MSSFEIISDYSKSDLKEIPEKILEMTNLKMLFLERNFLVKLPANFFHRLPNLMWLDLRNNQLKELPKSIAHHEHLEHLLLTNNNISQLPNELGLVANLKALQVADNPLVYPPRKVVQEGTKSIKKFLREQYEIESAKRGEQEINSQEKRLMEKRRLKKEMEEEQLIKVHEKESEFRSIDMPPKETFYTAHQISTQKLIEQIQNQLLDPNGLHPTLRVKKLDVAKSNKTEEPLKIVHSMNKSDSKISLKSYFQKTASNKIQLQRIPENVLKEGWLNKLRVLLNDQERILQQERNLRTLDSWRQKRPNTPRTPDLDLVSEAPYATYPEYSKIPSRTELAGRLQTFLKDSNLIDPRPARSSQINMDKVIKDLMEQLKEMENCHGTGRSPRGEMEHAGRQIQTIVDIHKKLLKLKSSNDYF